MHPADINAALIKRGYNQRKIAKEFGVSSMAVSHVIYGRSKSARIAQAISAATGLPLARLWPGKYSNIEKQAA